MNEQQPPADLELLTIGDATMDVYMNPTESETMCQIDTKECLICFSYGDKIPVKQIDFSVGGNAANNAVGARRLGVKVGMVSTLGGDLTGDQIVRKLEQENVDLTYTIQQPTANSNFSSVINYSGERTIFTYHAPRSYEFPVNMPAVPWIYLTSMGETFEPFYRHIVNWKKERPETKMAFNPGSRQLRAGADVLNEVLKETYLLYVNRQEAEMLTGIKDSHEKEKELLNALSALGPKKCIVTDGGGGSYVFDGERYLRSNILTVDAIERTGAGDSFGSGMLSALIKGKSFEEALLWGTVNAASVIGFIGSQRGLLGEEDLPGWVERARSSGVEVKEL